MIGTEIPATASCIVLVNCTIWNKNHAFVRTLIESKRMVDIVARAAIVAQIPSIRSNIGGVGINVVEVVVAKILD
jgi:hypothetical protein